MLVVHSVNVSITCSLPVHIIVTAYHSFWLWCKFSVEHFLSRN